MDKNAQYTLILPNNITYHGCSDGAGNIIVYGLLNRTQFENDNLKNIQIFEQGMLIHIPNPILRIFEYRNDEYTLLKIDNMTDFELLRHEIDILKEQVKQLQVVINTQEINK